MSKDYGKDLFNTIFTGAKSLVSRKLAVTGGSMYTLHEAGEPMLMMCAGGVYVLAQALVEAFRR